MLRNRAIDMATKPACVKRILTDPHPPIGRMRSGDASYAHDGECQ